MTVAPAAPAESNMSVALRAARTVFRSSEFKESELAELARRMGAMDERDVNELRTSLKMNLAVRWFKAFELAFYLVFWLAVSSALLMWWRTALVPADVDQRMLLVFQGFFTLAAGFIATVVLYFTGLLCLPESLRLRALLLDRLALASTDKELCQQAWETVQAQASIAQYREAVLASGRALTLLDLGLMFTWSYKLEVQNKEQERDLACKQMHGLA